MTKIASDEIEIPLEARGVRWPLTIYVCQQCSRPTLFQKDRCCSGFQTAILVMPIGREQDEWLIEELDIGVRAYNCLKRVGIHTVGQLVERTELYIQAIPNMGVLTMRDLKEGMDKLGLQFKEENK